MDIKKLCTPALVYFVISIITLFFAILKNFQLSSLIIKLIFVGAWTWFLNFLCNKGYKVISWFLVLLPFLMMLGIFAMILEIAGNAYPSMR
jgi:hypothetical protein